MADVPAVAPGRIGTAASDIMATHAMTNDVCWRLLGEAALGQAALGPAAGRRPARPRVFPVNHVTDGHTIIIRTGATSPLALLAHREPVTFEVDDGDPAPPTGWTVLLGELYRVDRNARTELDPQLMAWGAREDRGVMRIAPTRVTGLENTRRRRHPDDLLP